MDISSPPSRLVGIEAPITKLPKNFPLTIDDNLSLGIDLGIGSCGLALVSSPDAANPPTIRGFENLLGQIRFMGVRTFDVPETKEKTGPKLKNPARRQARLLRRGTARRAQRMRAIRNLLISEGILSVDYSHSSPEWMGKHEAATPWGWRLDALEKCLEPWQWAAVLIHFAKHRGFRSNRKSDIGEKGKAGGTLESSKANHEALEHFRTLGEMFDKDPRFSERKRNRDGNYTSLILRADLIKEIEILFAKQRELGSAHAGESFELEYIRTLQTQRPLQDPVKLLESCPFEPTQKRGSRLAPAFELSRALQKLNSLTLVTPGRKEIRFIDHSAGHAGAYEKFIAEFGIAKKVSWKSVREIFHIPPELTFKDLIASPAGKGKKSESKATSEADDFVNRGAKGCAQGTHAFRSLLGADWDAVVADGFETVDEAAFALTFYEVVEDEESSNTIFAQLAERCADFPRLIEKIRADFESEKPTIHGFTGSVSISALASRKIVPHLARGLVYSEAMEAAGYRHTDSSLNLQSITNPVVQSVVREAMKQIIHLICETGRIPGKINVELARDLGKSIDERNDIKRGLDKRTTERNNHREQTAEILGIPVERVSDEDLLKYELLHEQGALCPYSGETLPRDKSLFGAAYQIDHILPRSRSQDNSYDNRVLVLTGANQNKKQRTPFEWLGGPDSQEWLDFVTRVQAMRGIRGRKRRNLLDANFANREQEFIERNLVDTRYISRVVAAFLQDIYLIAGEKPQSEKGSRRRVNARPGALTAMVRKAWGLEDLKKDMAGKRLGDKHHAVDALICACIGEKDAKFVTELSKAWGEMENLHEHKLVPKKLPIPWESFRYSVVGVLDVITVSRREDCGGKGQLHDDTVYGRDLEGTGWKRTSLISSASGKKTSFLDKVATLEEIRGARLSDIQADPRNQWFRAALLKWIEAGSPVEAPPLDTNGKVINKVFRSVSSNSLRKIPRGWVSNGNMIRCDVFAKKGKYALIPVYSHHLRDSVPPMKFIKAHKPECEWGVIDETYQFEFSLWKNSRFMVKEKPKRGVATGLSIIGNYVGVDRVDGRITYNLPDDHGAVSQRVSPVTSFQFQKLHADRLGRVFPIPKEKRTWRGKVFI